MKKSKLKNFNSIELHLEELNCSEMSSINGGFLPLAAILVCDGIMLACSACALGMKQAMKDAQGNP